MDLLCFLVDDANASSQQMVESKPIPFNLQKNSIEKLASDFSEIQIWFKYLYMQHISNEKVLKTSKWLLLSLQWQGLARGSSQQARSGREVLPQGVAARLVSQDCRITWEKTENTIETKNETN